jgi:AraC-like DNA-binding protein
MCGQTESVGERAPHRLGTGDVFVVPAERSCVLASDLKASPVDGLALFTKATDNVGSVGDGQDFLAIGGHVALDPDRGGLLADVLPPLIHVDASSSEASTIRWLLDQLVKEVTANRPGAVLASKQLAQLLFVQIIRFYIAAATTVTAGWLRALNDERIAPALRLMHGEPGRAWRLGDLAKHVGMSRTSFAMRFKTNAGVAPLTYLQNLRMRIAEQGLRDGKMSVAELAEFSRLRIRQRVQQRVQEANRHGTQALSIRPRTDGPAHIRCGRSESTARILSESLTRPALARHRQTVRRH